MSIETEAILANFVYLGFEFFKYLIFIGYVMGGKLPKYRYTVAAGIFFTFIITLLEHSLAFSDAADGLRYALSFLFLLLMIQGNLRNRLYITMVSFSFLSVLNTICQILTSALFSSLNSYSVSLILSAVWFEFCTIWLFLLFTFILYRMIGPKEPVPPRLPFYFLIIGGLDVCCALSILYEFSRLSEVLSGESSYNTIYPQPPFSPMGRICLLCLGIIFLVASLFIHILSNARTHYVSLLDTQEKYIALQTRYYDQQQRNYQDMRAFRHDLKNHLGVIFQLNQSGKHEEVTEYIRNLDLSIQKNPLYFDCGHPIASALVSYAALRAKDHDIIFSCVGHLPENLHIEAIDLCTILGNILDNALESCHYCLESQGLNSPLIDLRFLYKNGHTILVLENSTIIAKIEENAPLSSLKKAARDHGIGMQNVIQVLQKYDASICWKAENYIFYTEIIL